DEGALAAFAGDVGENRTGLPHQPHVMDITPAEMEAFYAEPVIFGGAILFDIAARLQGGEQPENIVLVQLEALGKFSHAQFVDVAEELFEHVERVRDRLNNVVCLFATQFSSPFRGDLR